MNDTTPFLTEDMRCAAFLLARGHRLLDLSGSLGERRRFHFPSGARRDADAYYKGAQAPALQLFRALDDMRALLRRT